MTGSTYVPGAHFALVTPHGWALVDVGAGADVVLAVHRSLHDGEGVAAILQVLTGAFGTSLTAIPPFALAVRGSDGLHVAVRGPLEARVTTARGEEVLAGTGVTTWSERLVEDADEVVLGGLADDRASVGDDALPLEGGVVHARSVRGFILGAPSTSAADVPDAVTVAPVVAPAVVPVAATVAAPVQPPAPAPVATVAVPSEETSFPTQTSFPGVDVADDYDHLWGSTVLRPIEDAAVREDEVEEEDFTPSGFPEAVPRALPRPASSALPDVTALPELTVAPTSDDAEDETPSEPIVPEQEPELEPELPPTHELPAAPAWKPPFFIDAVPGVPPRTAPPAPVVPPARVTGPFVSRPDVVEVSDPDDLDDLGDLGDHDGETVFARPARAAASPVPSAGRVVLSTGATIELDRPLVVGRKPRVSRVASGDMPRLVTVPSPEQDISRSHVEVRLEDLNVLVVDLGSTNGSTLLRMGQLPVRLHPHEAVLVVTGDVIDLGEGITMTFEGLA